MNTTDNLYVSEKDEELKAFISRKIGEASMCWSEAPKGVFETAEALKIIDEIMARISP